MGTIKRFNNGEFDKDMGEFNGKVLGQPFLCVCGVAEPKHSKGQEVIKMPLVGGISAYIRYMTSDELNEHLSGLEDVKIAGTIVLTDKMAEYFNLNVIEEFAKAMKFMEDDGINISDMLEHVANLGGLPAEFVECIPQDDPQRLIKVVTTKHHDGQYGAAVLANTNMLDSIRNKINDFYIIPSSIHEIIAIPKALGEQIDNLAMMVKEVNEEVVAPQDVLSNDVLMYDEKGLHLA